MQHFRLLAYASALVVLTAGAAMAEKPFEGVELKMLGIGDTSVTTHCSTCGLARMS